MSRDFEKTLELQLKGYRLTTAEILYHLPDYPDLLQSYIWQEYDISPDFPVLHKFLHFWEHNIDGRLHTVQITGTELIRPSKFQSVDTVYTLH